MAEVVIVELEAINISLGKLRVNIHCNSNRDGTGTLMFADLRATRGPQL